MNIPSFLEHLPRHGEYPVPFVVLWIEGKPDFRTIDTEKAVRCYKERLCAICGRRLGEFSYFIGGDGCKRSHAFRDPAMHRECAEFSTLACPFLSGKRTGYSERALPNVPGYQLGVRPGYVPERTYIFKTRTRWTRIEPERGGGAVFVAGQWLGVTEITEGVPR
jgi:hypothetical protein